jgi:hypothetical protein
MDGSRLTRLKVESLGLASQAILSGSRCANALIMRAGNPPRTDLAAGWHASARTDS